MRKSTEAVSLWEQRRELEEAWRAARRLHADATRGVHDLDSARTEARRDLARAHAAGDPKLVKQREAELTVREREADRHALKVEGLALAEQERERALLAFESANVDGLLTELLPQAQAVAQRMERALYEEVPAAVAEYREVAGIAQNLITRTGHGRDLVIREVPAVANNLAREVARAEAVEIPVPLPESVPYTRLLTTDREGNLVDAAATTP
jgi:hypothetical protein